MKLGLVNFGIASNFNNSRIFTLKAHPIFISFKFSARASFRNLNHNFDLALHPILKLFLNYNSRLLLSKFATLKLSNFMNCLKGLSVKVNVKSIRVVN